MNKDRQRHIFVKAKVRKYYLDTFGKFCITKYCLIDIIRRFSQNEENAFLYKQVFLSKWLGINEPTVSYHLKGLIEIDLIRKTSVGFVFTEKFPASLYREGEIDGSFVIIDFEIKEALDADLKYMTIEQFMILTTIFKIKFDRMKFSKKSFARMLLMHRTTIDEAISRCITLGLMKDNRKSITDECRYYFEPLKHQLRSMS